ncbi:MAG: PLP-dependent aminotransferase family protein [Candidatus Nomurabacteria bacterium]|jgi:DNA-binding transcriptional MocR family regulator|nr:PLP-dependent aminotransferase family protein [Candidatus Nomurabacteria bacterium]
MIQEEKIKQCLRELVDTDSDIYNYATPKGLKELRVNIAKYLDKKLNSKVNENNILITSGSQQSIYLLSRVLSNQGDTIASEEPTFFGAIAVFKEIGVEVLTVEINDDGINLNELREKISSSHPKFIYVVPTFHNPTGISWDNTQRKDFLKIINEYGVTVIEDDPCSELNYTDDDFKTLYELNEGKNIIYLGTFSKLICPSLSVGYILADNAIIERLYEYKLLNDMNTSLFIQKFVNLYLEKYNIVEDIAMKKAQYQKNARLIKEKLSNEFDNISFSNMRGGLFMTVNIPKSVQPTSPYDTNHYDARMQDFIRADVSKANIDELVDTINIKYKLKKRSTS